MTQAQNLADLSQQYMLAALGNRNSIIDGNFDYWTAPSLQITTTTGYSPAAIWRASPGTGGTANISRYTFPVGGEPLGFTTPYQFVYIHAQQVASTGSVATSDAPFIQQRIESVNTLQGRSSTFSVWLWVNTGTLTITNVLARQFFGTTGSPSPTVIIDPVVNWVLTTTPQRFSVRIDWPPTLNKTLGTDGNDFTQIGVWFSPTALVSYGVAQPQLEQSQPSAPAVGTPTPFEYRGRQAEIARVQRFFDVITLPALISNGSSSYGGAFASGYLKVSMRVAPVLTLNGSLVGSATVGVSTSSGPGVVSWNFAGAAAVGTYYNPGQYFADARL